MSDDPARTPPKLRRQFGDLPWHAPDFYTANQLAQWVRPQKLLRGMRLRAGAALRTGVAAVTLSRTIQNHIPQP